MPVCRTADLLIALAVGLDRVLEGLGVQPPIVAPHSGFLLGPFGERREPRMAESPVLSRVIVLRVRVGWPSPETDVTLMGLAFVGAVSAPPGAHLSGKCLAGLWI